MVVPTRAVASRGPLHRADIAKSMADAKPKGQKASEVAELKKQMELMQSMLETQRKEIEAMRAKKNATLSLIHI